MTNSKENFVQPRSLFFRFVLCQTRDPAEDPFSHLEADPVAQALLVVVVQALLVVVAQALLVVVEALAAAHLDFQEPLLVAVAVPLIFPRAAQVFHPGKTLQEVLLLPYPTHLDLLSPSRLVGAHLHHHSPQDQGRAMDLHLDHQAFHQGGTALFLRHQEVPHQALDQASPRLLLHLQIAADLPYRLLQEGGPLFLMIDRHHHLPLEDTGHPYHVTCHLLLLQSTPNLLRLLLLPHLLVPHLVGAHLLFRQDVQGLLPYLPPQEEVMTPHLVYPKETARSTGTDKVLSDMPLEIC